MSLFDAHRVPLRRQALPGTEHDGKHQTAFLEWPEISRLESPEGQDGPDFLGFRRAGIEFQTPRIQPPSSGAGGTIASESIVPNAAPPDVLNPATPDAESAPEFAADAPERILVVEDDPHLLKALARALARAGFLVEAAGDGVEGWQALRSQVFHLLITDHDMPGMTGLDLIARARLASMTLPAILVSGALPETSPALDEPLRIAFRLPKPFSLRTLLAAVRSALHDARTELQAARWIHHGARDGSGLRQVAAIDGSTGTPPPIAPWSPGEGPRPSGPVPGTRKNDSTPTEARGDAPCRILSGHDGRQGESR